MTTESERTYAMKNNFMALHNDGYSIPEIANKFNLSSCTVYRHLEQIAIENNVKRDTLLQKVVPPRSEPSLRHVVEKTKASFNELDKTFSMLENTLKESIQHIDQILMEDKDYEE